MTDILVEFLSRKTAQVHLFMGAALDISRVNGSPELQTPLAY